MKLGFALALLASTAGFAQGPVNPAAQLRMQTTVVVVPALVRNAQGELVFTLKADDFRITDDGIEQRLTMDEDTDSEPLALAVVVETGGAGARRLGDFKHLGAVISAVTGGVPHRVAVVSFDSEATLQQDFSSDDNAAGATLDNLSAGDKGAAILDGLAFAVDLLRKQPAVYRRAILLISETIDHGSQTQLGEALRIIGDTNTAMYTLGFSSGNADAAHYASRELPFQSGPDGARLENAHQGPPHGCMGKDPDPDATTNKAVQAFDCLGLLAPPLALAKLAAIRAADGLQRNVPESVAQMTGGEYFKFENSRSLVRGLMTISNHVPNRYVLSFHPQAPHPGFHAIELRLNDRPGLHVTARSGYWADEEKVARRP